ncbi:MAG: hypothetical protein ACTSUX_04700 [Promethearchaeota archaeon]
MINDKIELYSKTYLNSCPFLNMCILPKSLNICSFPECKLP